MHIFFVFYRTGWRILKCCVCLHTPCNRGCYSVCIRSSLYCCSQTLDRTTRRLRLTRCLFLQITNTHEFSTWEHKVSWFSWLFTLLFVDSCIYHKTAGLHILQYYISGLLLLNGKDRAGIGQKSDRNVMKPMPLNKVPWPARCNKKIQ